MNDQDAFIERLYEAISPLRKLFSEHHAETGEVDRLEDKVVDALEEIVSKAYRSGYAEGAADAEMEAAAQEADHQDHLKDIEDGR